MSSYYKTKETALRHIEAGENFRNKTFQKFWNDKEVFLAAVENGFGAHKSDGVNLEGWGKTRDDAKKFPDWYENWCWEANYVHEMATAIVGKQGFHQYDLQWLAAFLPDSFTGDVEILKSVLPSIGFYSGDFGQQLTGNARLKHREFLEQIGSSVLTLMDKFNRALYERNPEMVRINPAVAAQLVKARHSYLPSTLLKNRDFCFQLVKEHGCWCGVILDCYREDRDFVTDLYEAAVSVDFNSLSYEIRKLVRKEDPRTFLSAYRLREQLENSVPATSTQAEVPQTKRLKI